MWKGTVGNPLPTSTTSIPPSDFHGSRSRWLNILCPIGFPTRLDWECEPPRSSYLQFFLPGKEDSGDTIVSFQSDVIICFIIVVVINSEDSFEGPRNHIHKLVSVRDYLISHPLSQPYWDPPSEFPLSLHCPDFARFDLQCRPKEVWPEEQRLREGYGNGPSNIFLVDCTMSVCPSVRCLIWKRLQLGSSSRGLQEDTRIVSGKELKEKPPNQCRP